MKNLSKNKIDRVLEYVPVIRGKTKLFCARLARGDHLGAIKCIPRKISEHTEGGEKWTGQPKRLAFLAEVSGFLTDKEYAETLRVVWITSEKSIDEGMFWTLFDGARKGTALLGLTKKEQAFLKRLPNSFIIYRGCTKSTRDGYCWTTKYNVAEKFASTHHAENNKEKKEVLKRMCSKTAIRAIYLGAGEYEVVVNYQELDSDV